MTFEVFDTLSTIDAALTELPDQAPVVMFDQANADTIAAVDRAAELLALLRATLEWSPENRPAVDDLTRQIRNALGDACAARDRYLKAADAMARCSGGAH